MIKNFKWLLLVSLTFVACNNDDEVVTVSNSSDGQPLTAGSANFSKYVALGDSFAAGYSDYALFIKGQEGAYPNVMAQQFALVGGGAFTTPFMADNFGGFLFMGNVAGANRLYFNGTAPVPVPGTPTTEITTHLNGPFNNMGLPGAKSFHLVAPNYGLSNPYFGRFASAPGVKVVDDAKAQQASFFSLWIGGNDILTYATSGGIGENRTGNFNPATYNTNDITDPTVFAGAYTELITKMTENGAKGVVANLPYVSTLPYFTTVPTSPLSPSILGGTAGVAQINGLYTLLRTALGVDADRIKLFDATKANPLLIKDESLPSKFVEMNAFFMNYFNSQGDPNAASNAAAFASIFSQVRQAGVGDYVLLTSSGLIGNTVAGAPSTINKLGITYPFQDGAVLTADEALQIKVATDAYNITIKSIADSKGLAFVDTKLIMSQLVSGGISANGFTVTATFVSGGGFSLDGVHPSPRGYALIANKFIEAINLKYGSNLKGVDLSKYRILFPMSL